MKSVILLLAFAVSSNVFALDFKTKGFFAFDTFSVQKKNDDNTKMEWGIGTIDLKFYFNHEKFSSKIKLDLDGSIDDSNALYEEATVRYKHSKNLKFTIGKGLIPFHQKRYGMLESSYVDGGSILNTNHNFRDQDRKMLLQFDYGSYKKGFKNKFALFASSKQPIRNSDGSLDTTDNTSKKDQGTDSKEVWQIEYETVKTINSKYEKGIANKFELYPTNGMTIGVAGVYLDREIDFHKNYAGDLSFKYRTTGYELWAEYVYAFVSNNPVDKYSAAKQNEQILQVGGEYRLTEKVSYVLNVEAAWINKLEHNNANLPTEYLAGTEQYSKYNNGNKSETNTYKIDTGFNYKAAKQVSLKLGVTLERKYSWSNDKYKGFQKAIQLGSGVSYWF